MSLGILVDENIPAVERYLGAIARVRRVNGRDLQRAHLQGVDALLVRSVTAVNEQLLRGSTVKFVGTATSGVDHIDRRYLQQRGIGFAYAPGSNANSVVEYVLAAIAAVGDKLEQLLGGGVVGIVGYGVIGKAMAARLQALGVDYRVYDPWLDQCSICRPASLDDILGCDVLSLHAELTREQPWPSYHLLGQAQLAALDRQCLLINTSRGPVVDNAALLSLLNAGRGPVSVLDVWQGEPAIDHQLLARVTLGTAHIAGYSLDGRMLATRMLCDALAEQLGLTLPAVSAPPGVPSPAHLSVSAGGAGLMRQLLQARYDITRDDALLRRATLGQDSAAAASRFDKLRREYRERRELLGCTVSGEFQSQADIALVQGLGCVPAAGGQS